MVEGLTDQDIKTFLELCTKANNQQLKAMEYQIIERAKYRETMERRRIDKIISRS